MNVIKKHNKFYFCTLFELDFAKKQKNVKFIFYFNFNFLCCKLAIFYFLSSCAYVCGIPIKEFVL